MAYSGSKTYKEKGELKQLSHNQEIKVDAVSPGLQSHTLKGLVPHTTYEIELSAFNSMGEGPSIKLTVKTDKGSPPPLQRPVIIEDELSDEFIPMELEIASERNGPIRCVKTKLPSKRFHSFSCMYFGACKMGFSRLSNIGRAVFGNARGGRTSRELLAPPVSRIFQHRAPYISQTRATQASAVQ